MLNAKDELIRELEACGATVKAALISYEESYETYKDFTLKLNYLESNWINFLNQLDFNYDSGYGCQRLFGTVWLSDGTWLERAEYDGSEWWIHHKCPEIPDYLSE